MKYYAVKKGRKAGIYTTWDECKAQVYGYSDAKYKAFDNRKEAEAFIEDGSGEGCSTEIEAYVDGSFSESSQKYSFGCVMIKNGEIIHTISGCSADPDYVEMRNVAGELEASEQAIRWAISNKAKSIRIYHDYEGIASWANGEWTANKKGTKEYVSFIKASQEKIRIEFTKVKGHSGVKYNEMADRLAKEGMNRVCMDNYTTQFKEFLEKNVCEEGKFSIVIKNTVVTEKSITAFVKKMLKEKKYKKVTNLKIRYMIDENYLDVIFDANGEMKKELKIKILN